MSITPSTFENPTNKKIENGVTEMEDCRKLILELKRARIDKGYSYNMMADMLAGTENAIASSTIAKVFAKGSEEQTFNYYGTLLPLKKLLLEDDDAEKREDYKFEILNLQSEIKVRDVTIQMLKAQIEALQGEKALLKSQVDIKDKRMNDQTEMINRIMDESEKTRIRIMDRNDNKDATIHDLMEENKRLEEDLRELMSRCKLCDKYVADEK